MYTAGAGTAHAGACASLISWQLVVVLSSALIYFAVLVTWLELQWLGDGPQTAVEKRCCVCFSSLCGGWSMLHRSMRENRYFCSIFLTNGLTLETVPTCRATGGPWNLGGTRRTPCAVHCCLNAKFSRISSSPVQIYFQIYTFVPRLRARIAGARRLEFSAILKRCEVKWRIFLTPGGASAGAPSPAGGGPFGGGFTASDNIVVKCMVAQPW